MSNIPTYTKMHGLGNDFILLPAVPDSMEPAAMAAWVRALCDRHRGIGADGVIYAAPPSDPAAYDIRFVYWNADGSTAEMCGNGIRCFTRYLHVHHQLLPTPAARDVLHAGQLLRIETGRGLVRCQLDPQQDGQVCVEMGPPVLSWSDIPFCADESTVEVNGLRIPLTPVSMGNPHAVVFQADFSAPLDPAVYGPALEVHPAFPAKVNVSFVTVENRNTLHAVVWERGCGFTQACGTGACAIAVAAQLRGLADPAVDVWLPGGALRIAWEGQTTAPVWMTGPASFVFTVATSFAPL
jgi:diaminopimelate epimerase